MSRSNESGVFRAVVILPCLLGLAAPTSIMSGAASDQCEVGIVATRKSVVRTGLQKAACSKRVSKLL